MSEPKQTPVFPVDQMIDLLKNIDNNVRQIVYSLREKGAKVRTKVVDLMNTYMELLAKVLDECGLFENTIGILQRRLQSNSDILTLVMMGTGSKVLEDLALDVDKYKKYFEGRRVYQLMKDDFQVEQLKLPESTESDIIKDKIEGLRRDFKNVEGVIRDVKEMGEKGEQSCNKIAEDFEKFLQDISDTREAISTLLASLDDDKKAMIENQMWAAAAAVGCIVGFLIGAVYWYKTGPAAVAIPKVATPLLGGVAAGVAYYDTEEQKQEMEKVQKALKDVCTELDTMREAAGKQKMDWNKVLIQVTKIVDQVKTSGVEETAGNLDPSHSTPVNEVRKVIEAVLKDAAILEANVVQFKQEAERVQENLRDLSVMKKTSETDVVLAKPRGPPRSVFQPLWDFVTIAKKALPEDWKKHVSSNFA